jgi:hypothetical protein
LLKAADRAEQKGRQGLANAIREDVDRHCKASPLKATDVYTQIRDWVWEEEEDLPYRSIMKALANLYYLYPEEIERKYKKCRTVYGEAVKERKLEHELRERYEKILRSTEK